MTHDELLTRLDYHRCVYTPALRAVVELHKPCCDLEELCNECNPNVPYPCPTIQAVEEELG